MATPQTIRVNTRTAVFPLLSRDYGRTVIADQRDEHNSGVSNYSGSESKHNLGTAEVMYMENVVPVAEGLRSVCYEPIADTCLMQMPADSNLYRTKLLPKHGVLVHSKHSSVALLHGKSFMFHRESHTLYRAFPGCNMEPQALSCELGVDILGIASTGARLVAYAKDRIYWSNIGADEELDFVPSFTNGAGSAIPTQLKGDIVAVFPLHDSLIIYTTENAVEMHFSTNIHLKYQFNEIPRVGGLLSPLHVAWESNAGYHVAMTTNGIQKISRHRQATFEFPYPYEFLQGDTLEDYHGLQAGIESLNQIPNDISCTTWGWSSETQYPLDGDHCSEQSIEHPSQLQERIADECLDVAVNFIGSELIAFSFGASGEGQYEYILTWHEGLQRFGRLKREHSHAYEVAGRVGLNQLGTFNLGEASALVYKHKEDCEAVIILGRYQTDRGHITTARQIEIERIYGHHRLDTYWLYSLDGVNWLKDHVPCEVIRSDNMRSYKSRVSAKNLALKLVGTFTLTSVVLTFINNGRL